MGITQSRGDPEDVDALAFKLDARGELVWERAVGSGSGTDNFWGLWPQDGGSVVAAGQTTVGERRAEDAWLVTIGPEGEIIGRVVCGGEGFDVLSGVQVLSDGGVIAGGQTRAPGSDVGDVWLLRLGPR